MDRYADIRYGTHYIGSSEIYVPGIRIRISLICGTRYQAQAWKSNISLDTSNNLGTSMW